MATKPSADLLFLRFDGSEDTAQSNGAYGGLNLDAVMGPTEVSSTVLDNGGGTGLAHALAPYNEDTASLSLDASAEKYFYVDQTGEAVVGKVGYEDATIYAGSTVTGAPIAAAGSTATTASGSPAPTALYSALTPAELSADTDTSSASFESYLTAINDTVVNAPTNTLYFSQTVENANNNDSAIGSQTGIFSLNLATDAVASVVTNLANPDVIALDLSQGLIFFTDSTGDEAFQGGDGQSGDPGPSVNDLDVYNIATGKTTVLISEAYHPDDEIGGIGYGGNTLDGLAVDPTTDTLYYTTNNVLNILANTQAQANADNAANPGANVTAYADTQDAIYKVSYALTGGTVLLGVTTTLYSGANAFDPSRIAIDPANGVFYVDGNSQKYVPDIGSAFPYNEGVYEGSLTATNTTALTRVTPVSETADSGDATNTNKLGEVLGTTFAGQGTPGDGNVLVDDVPVVNGGSTVTFVQGAGAVTADPALTTSSTSQPNYVTATVAITGFEPGDVLTATTAGTVITASYAAASGTLTLSGIDSTAEYQKVLDSVTFNSTSANPTASGASDSRTLTYSVFDGLVTGSGTSTIHLEVAPTVTPGSPSTSFTGGGAAVVADPALTVADITSTTLAGATVAITGGFLAGDTLGFTAVNGISGSYNASTGVLTLAGTATVAQYQAALRSVTFGFTPINGNPTAGGDTSRTLSYTVTDGTVASAAATSTVTVVHAPPSVTAGSAVTFTRGDGTPVATDASGTVTAPDSGGQITGATVTIGAGHSAADVLAFTPANGIFGTYDTSTGVLTLSGTATSAQYQAALESVTFSTGNAAPAGSRTLTYTVTDGTDTSGSTTSTVSVTLPAPAIAGTAANQAVSDDSTIHPFSTVSVTDTAGETDSATIVLSSGGTATDADGTLSSPGAVLTKTGTGTYTLAATDPATLSSELNALIFTPSQVAPGSTVTTGFSLAVADTGGGTATNTATSVDVPCFCAGTRILTAQGEVAVEQLAVGEHVVTASGGLRPIVWIGTRRYAGRFLRANPAAQPVCITAGALGSGVPVRDLHVSPLHALLLDGVLVPAGELVNGVTITREAVDEVVYFHVELDQHDVLLAEGAPAESFMDDGSAGMFHNAATRPERCTPDAFCAPRLTGGYLVEAVRQRLAAARAA